jgi:hypothetical protein
VPRLTWAAPCTRPATCPLPHSAGNFGAAAQVQLETDEHVRHVVLPPGPVRPSPRRGAGAVQLLSHHLSVHAVDGIEPCLWHRVDDLLTAHRRTSRARARAMAEHLCLDQALGRDSAYTVFLSARLGEILPGLGIAATGWPRPRPASSSGACSSPCPRSGTAPPGLTFYDDEVAAAFRTDTACLMACSVGVPAYHPMPGGPRGRPATLARLPAPGHRTRR